MHLYLVQHGEALAKEVDPDRPLTAAGGAEVDKVANFLGGLIYPREIWHSGKLRARETAERLATHVGGRLVERQGLDPNDSVDETAHKIDEMSHDFLIAGHLPFLSRLASRLVLGSAEIGMVAFEQGGVVALAREDGQCWRVRWMVVPSLLR